MRTLVSFLAQLLKSFRFFSQLKAPEVMYFHKKTDMNAIFANKSMLNQNTHVHACDITSGYVFHFISSVFVCVILVFGPLFMYLIFFDFFVLF